MPARTAASACALTGTRRDRWQAPRAEEVKAVLTRAQARLLASDDDLLELVLESLERGETPNRITVPETTAIPARIALERMLAAKPAPTQAKI